MEEHVATKDRLNWLRAMVLGFLDGLVSVGSLLLGLVAANQENSFLIIAGISAIIGGSFSMAIGEYISVCSQRDSENADIQREILEHDTELSREHELEELTHIYIHRGLDRELAKRVAIELTKKDAIRAHVRDELNIDPDKPIKPIQASLSSGVSFLFGSLPPFLSVIFVESKNIKIISIILLSEFLFVSIALISAYLGGSRLFFKAITRIVIFGSFSLGITFAAGYFIQRLL